MSRLTSCEPVSILLYFFALSTLLVLWPLGTQRFTPHFQEKRANISA